MGSWEQSLDVNVEWLNGRGVAIHYSKVLKAHTLTLAWSLG